jgi:predicted Rossmann fold nucleotide-binding protein DprA/Smf involved in DNA uptake
LVETVIQQLPDVTEIHTGAARGIDTIAFMSSVEHWPDAKQRLFVPFGMAYNYPLLTWANRHVRQDLLDVQLVRGGYMKRNDALVADAEVLLAFPAFPGERRRSGTWATVRRARALGIPVHVFPLSKADELMERPSLLSV